MQIVNEGLSDFGIRNITKYATEVNLDRAVPELYDGLKPVLRRVAWSASHYKNGEAVKSAKIIGTCIGTFHPHGDSATYGAMQTIVHHNVPLLEGIGGWGSLLDEAAAYRYTLARLSKFGQDIFDSKYIAVTNMVPNYDNTAKEPVVLPVKLPLLILNGADGIGVGITCSIPTFTVDSVIKVLKELLSGKKLKYMDYAKLLRPKQHWGGQIVKTRENYQEWVNLMKTGRASIAFQSHVKVDEVKKEILVVDWPAGLNPLKFVDKVRNLPECSRAYNTMGLEYRVEFKKGGTRQQFTEFVEKVKRLLVAKANYKFNVTHRIAKTENGITSYTTEFLALNIPQFFERWVHLRVQLEKNCLNKQIENQQEIIAYSKLLIFASDHLDIIFKALRNADSCGYLVKYLKISEKEANQILDLKVRTLSKLDQTELKKKLKEQQLVLKDLKYKYSHPKETIINDLDGVVDLITLDSKMRDKKLEQELKVV